MSQRVDVRCAFLLSAQRALLTHVTPLLRSVSLSVDEPKRRYTLRFIFDGAPSQSQLEAAQCAATELLADFPDWEPVEEYLDVAAPAPLDCLEWRVFQRCEDDWVGPDK